MGTTKNLPQPSIRVLPGKAFGVVNLFMVMDGLQMDKGEVTDFAWHKELPPDDKVIANEVKQSPTV